MKPNSLAGLKRFIQPGVRLRRQHSRPELHAGLSEITIQRATTVGFTYPRADGKEVWHTYMKANLYAFTDTGFIVTLEGVGTVTYSYVEG